MFCKLTKNSDVKNILVVSLTNIGDIIAICPAMDVLFEAFPHAKLSVIVGPKGLSLFEQNPNIERVYVYDKHAPLIDKMQWVSKLREPKFDAVVDFRNTLIPFVVRSRTRTPPALFMPKGLHLVDKHLLRLKSIYDFSGRAHSRKAIVILPKDRVYVDSLLAGHIRTGERFVLVAPVAADSAKTWHPAGFAQVCDQLVDRYKLKIVMVGGVENIDVMADIQSQMKYPFLALAGKTNLVQVSELVNRSFFSIVHDSGIMHLASYFNRQCLALFGFTDPRLSGPWSANSGYIWKNQECERCARKDLPQRHTCMKNITAEDILKCIHVTQERVEIATITHD